MVLVNHKNMVEVGGLTLGQELGDNDISSSDLCLVV